MIGHSKQKQFVAQWDLIYHELKAVKNFHREYASVLDPTQESYHHHEESEQFTKKRESLIQNIVSYIEIKGSPFAGETPKPYRIL